MEISGTLKAKFDTQVVSDKFKKREFVLTTEASTPYPQFISMQVTQDKCDLLDKYNEGNELKVSFNIRGREWNGPQGIKYFNTIEAWRIERINGGEVVESAPTQATVATPVFNVPKSYNDDLPF